MSESNNNRSINDWLIHIDDKLTKIDDKLDSKADKSVVEKLDNRTNKLAIKQAGISGTVVLLVGYFKYMITGEW